MRMLLPVSTGLSLMVSACATTDSGAPLRASDYVGEPITAFATAFGSPSFVGVGDDGVRAAQFDFLVRTLTRGPQLPVVRYAPREEPGSSPTGRSNLAGGVPITSSNRRSCSIIARFGEDNIIQSVEASSYDCARLLPA